MATFNPLKQDKERQRKHEQDRRLQSLRDTYTKSRKAYWWWFSGVVASTATGVALHHYLPVFSTVHFIHSFVWCVCIWQACVSLFRCVTASEELSEAQIEALFSRGEMQ